MKLVILQSFFRLLYALQSHKKFFVKGLLNSIIGS
jgi:hypothetical protein